MKEITEDKRNENLFHIHVQGGSIVKILVLSNLIYILSIIPIKIQESCFGNTDKLILKFIWRGKSRNSQSIIEEKEEEWKLEE